MRKAMFPEQRQYHAGARHFVGTCAVNDDLAVAGKFTLAFLDIVRRQMHRARRSTGGLHPPTHWTARVEDQDQVTRFLPLPQFLHGESSPYAILAGSAPAARICSRRVSVATAATIPGRTPCRRWPPAHHRSASTGCEKNIRSGSGQAAIKYRRRRCQKGGAVPLFTRDMHGHRRRHGAQTRNEFRDQQCAFKPSRLYAEHVLCLANARIRLQRDPAEQMQNLVAPAAAQIEPRRVCDEARDHGDEYRLREAEGAIGGQSSRRQQPGQRRRRQTNLLPGTPPEKTSGRPWLRMNCKKCAMVELKAVNASFAQNASATLAELNGPDFFRFRIFCRCHGAGPVDRQSDARNRVSPGLDSNSISPWCRSATMRLLMTSPSPVPEPTVFVVKNGSKICDCTSGGMPGPSSTISTTMYSSSA